MKNAKIIYASLFVFILVFSFFIRFYVFHVSHMGSDEMQYLGLAYKIDNYGFSRYNLKDLYVTFLEDKKLIEVNDKYTDTGKSVLSTLPDYYDVPLFYKPPVLPVTVMLSHRIFGTSQSYFGASETLKGKDKQNYGQYIFKSQFYLSFLCFIFSFFGILLVFLITKYLFGIEEGLYSMFLFSITPINMMVFSRVWTDGIALCFMILTIYLYFKAKDKNSFLVAIIAGVFCAVAGLTRAVALWVLPVVFVAELLTWVFKKRDINIKQQLKLFGVFAVTGFLLSLPWFIALYKTYGTFFYFPAKNLNSFEGNEWLTLISARSFLVFIINPLTHNPLLILFYLFFIRFSFFKGFFGNKDNIMFKNIVLVVLFLSFMIVFSYMPFKELRYVLPAIFVMIVFSGAVIKSFRVRFFEKTGALQGAINLFCLFVVASWWSISLAKYFINKNSALIQFPF